MLTLIVNCRIFTPERLVGTGGTGCVLVGGGKVLYAGSDVPGVDDSLVAERLDLGGGSVIPGLVDSHVHVTGGGGEDGFSTQVPAVGLSEFTRHGVTTVVGLLGADDETRSTANLLARTRALREEGLSAFCWTGGYHIPPTTLTGSVRGDITHLDCVIGAGEVAISDHRSSQPTFDELARLASEVHAGGMLAAKAGVLHLHLGDGGRGLELVRRLLEETELPAGMFHPTHVNRRKPLFDEACELSHLGVTVDLTTMPAEHDEEWSAEDAWALYLERGCSPERITVSSDSGGCLPRFDENGRVVRMGVASASGLIGFIRTLHGRGEPLERILPCVTSNVSKLLMLTGKGRIEAGADADLVCLDESLEVRHVMAGGRWMVRDGEAPVRGTFE
jgi:beta-aspartyl-dipeptidase (metallo-type)